MSVEMKLGMWQARNGQIALIVEHAPGMTFPWRACGAGCWTDRGGHLETKPSIYDLVRYLGPLELSQSTASAEAGPAGASTVSTEDPQESLRRMRRLEATIRRELEIYLPIVNVLKTAVSNLDEEIKRLEKEVEG